MKRLLFLFPLFLIITHHVLGQAKAPAKPDTSKLKSSIKINLKEDSLHVKFPLTFSNSKFERIESADLKLADDVPIEKYGFVDTADLKLSACDFEKDANAMVLFDRAEMACGVPNILMERHKRIKIFNDNGKKEANIRIEFNNRFGEERVLAIEAQTINLNNGKIEYTKLDPKLIYGEHADKNKDAIIFTMPNVKAGSIIEYRYVWERAFSRNIPDWAFQCSLPTRYSQIDVI